ncbi:hypothetical protein LCGC14_1311300, partial [marine sediment metagenome]
MVQEGGADSLRIDIAIETRAKLQAIEEASQRLQKLSVHAIQTQNALGRFTGEIEARMTPALQKSGAALADILRTGFSPRFIGSIQGVNAALLGAGKTFQIYTNEALKSGAISAGTASSFSQLSQSMVAVGVTGKVTVETLNELSNQLAQIQPRTEAGRVGVKALGAELDVLKIQFIEAGNAAQQRLNRPLTDTQKAGQGLLLSFSLSQLAAGRLSQAMFGLGFAVLFTGFKFLNLITITVALTAALSGFVLDKLVTSLQKGADVTERVSEQMQEFTDILAEVKGEARLLEEAYADLVAQGEDVAAGFARQVAEAKEAPSQFRIAAEGAKTYFRILWEGTKALSGFSSESGKMTENIEEAGYAFRLLFDEAGRIQVVMTEAEKSIRGVSAALRESVREFQEGIARAAELEAVSVSFEIDRSKLESGFNTVKAFIEQSMEEQNT